jgi:predicted phosphodiesterase
VAHGFRPAAIMAATPYPPRRGLTMRLAIISDIHANLEALQATLRRIGADRIDRIVCLGDIVGYNADPAACVDEIRRSGALCVAGNHDRAACGQITTDGFSPTAARAIAWTRSRLAADAVDFLAGLPLTRCIDGSLVAVHGALHPDTGQELVRLDNEERRKASSEALLSHSSGARVCAFGHTHVLGVYAYRRGLPQSTDAEEVALRDDAVYLINPGSVGQPRTAEWRATYLVLDTARQNVSVRRVEYDVQSAFAKTRAAGLMPRAAVLPSVRAGLRWGARAAGLHNFLKTNR